jgi:hypothetical protein
MDPFFVYIDWTREENPRPFYVGKGDEGRVKLLERKNPRHRAISVAYGRRREVVFSTLDEQAAFDLEEELIARHKTRGDLEGQWSANFTAGGGGVRGRKHDEETKKQISEKLAGKSKSEATRLKMRTAKSKKPIVQYSLEGEVVATYPSQMQAFRETNITNIGLCCRRGIDTAGGFVWRFESDHFDPKPKAIWDESRREISRQNLMVARAALKEHKKNGLQY